MALQWKQRHGNGATAEWYAVLGDSLMALQLLSGAKDICNLFREFSSSFAMLVEVDSRLVSPEAGQVYSTLLDLRDNWPRPCCKCI